MIQIVLHVCMAVLGAVRMMSAAQTTAAVGGFSSAAADFLRMF